MKHREARLAIRSRLLTLEVCTTGSTTLAATATGYTRAAGSFLTDGFAVGMEVTPSGFSHSDAEVITAVSALSMTTNGSHGAQTAASGRSLTVGLPAARAWENVEFEPEEGVPHVSEQYLPGPGAQFTLGRGGEMEYLPMYVVQFHVPEGKGVGAADGYAQAVIQHFPPITDLSITGATLRVRSQPAPFAGQVLRIVPGFASVTVNVPLRLGVASPTS